MRPLGMTPLGSTQSDAPARPHIVSALRPAWRAARVWLAVSMFALHSVAASAEQGATIGSADTATPGQAVLEDQVLPAAHAPAWISVGARAAARAVRPGQLDDLLTVSTLAERANRSPTDGLAQVLGPVTNAPGEPTFDYSALARDVGDQTRYGNALHDAAARVGDRVDASDADPGENVHATFSVAAGSGGMRQTRASVTVPLLDNQLTVRVTGEKGSNTDHRYSRSDLRDVPFLLGPRFGARVRDNSELGIDLRWTPNGDARNDHRREPRSESARDH